MVELVARGFTSAIALYNPGNGTTVMNTFEPDPDWYVRGVTENTWSKKHDTRLGDDNISLVISMRHVLELPFRDAELRMV